MTQLSLLDVGAAVDPRKHEWRGNGWRRHVISWALGWDGNARRKCSEPECEVNRR